MSRRTDEEGAGTSAADDLIRQARIELQAARNVMFEEMAQGGVSEQTRREVAVATLKLYDALWEERDNRAVKDEWENSQITDIEGLLNRTANVKRPGAGRGSNGAAEEVPAIVAVQIDYLDEVSREVKQMANMLGKGPTVRDPAPEDEASLSDLRGLLKARDQKEALKHLPEGSDAGA